jgi:hypothetical protein
MPHKPAARRPATLSTDVKRMGIRLLQARVDELEKLDIASISSGEDPRVQELSARILSTLSQIYGEDSLQYARLLGGGPSGFDALETP